MKAALLLGHGGPEQLAVRDDVAMPTPSAGEVLVAVGACGVNNTDINTRIGWYGPQVDVAIADLGDRSGRYGGGGTESPGTDQVGWSGSLHFPLIQGADVCGRVIGVGSSDNDSLLGQRVLVDPCLRQPGDPLGVGGVRYLGSECDGGFAEYTCVPAVNAHPISSNLSDVELATFPCSGATAENMLDRAGVEAGTVVAVTGASGGVGSLLVQLAARRHAVVVAVTSASKAVAVRNLGADHIVERDHPNVSAEARRLAGQPLDVVADVVGGPGMPMWLSVLRRRGRYVTAGAIAGPMATIDLRTLYLNDLTMYGVTSFEPRIFADLIRWIERGDIRPMVGGVYALDEIHTAQSAFGAKQHVGSIVLTPH